MGGAVMSICDIQINTLEQEIKYKASEALRNLQIYMALIRFPETRALALAQNDFAEAKRIMLNVIAYENENGDKK
jgi:hypothetical protein